MRTNTNARPVERPCSLIPFMHALSHQPALGPSSIPQTLRAHIGTREFGDFGTVLMAERPASSDLSKNVERWRNARGARRDLPLHAHPDQTAEDRRFNILFVLTPITIMLWVVIGLMVAWLRGNI